MDMELIQALDFIYLYKIEGETGNAWKVANLTEGSTSESRAFDTVPTKDGAKKTPGAYEGSNSFSSLLGKGDPSIAKLKGLVRKANPEKLLVWGIDRTDIGEETTLPGEFSRNVVTSVDTSAGSEGNVEISFETEVEGTVINGEVNVTPALLEILQLIKDEQAFLQPTESEEGE